MTDCQVMTPQSQTLQFLPDPDAVRQALDQITAACRTLLPPEPADMVDDVVGDVQIALAEAMNNIAEHAFVGLPLVPAQVSLSIEGGLLRILLQDRGHPLPAEILEPRGHQDLNVEIGDLPEGGFGWMLIHELTQRIEFVRDGGENRLTLYFPLQKPKN